MKQITPVAKLATYLSWLAAVIIALVPFHAFLTVWVASLAGHYTLLRLWKEFLLLPLVLGSLYLLARNKALRRKFWSLTLTKLILAYFLLLIICAAVALARHTVTAKAMWYGVLVDSRFLVFFLAIIIVAASAKILRQNWLKLLMGPALLVAVVAILQYLVLPYDFLKHFGYNQNTIYPYETINHNINHIRVMSTLRGANPLGAYIIVPLSVVTVGLTQRQKVRGSGQILAGGLALALIFSFSRSAWLGAALAITTAAWLCLKSDRLRHMAGWWAAGLVVLACLLSLGLRNNHSFQDVFLHTDSASTIAQSSNQGHSAAFKSALKDIYHQPLGRGVGTAGPQSVYNNGRTRLAEDYFLQIGQEAGILGLILFVAICAALAKLLYAQRRDPLALALLASLIGLSLVNLLSHAWADDTLAYVFWGLAGIALAPLLASRKNT